MLTTAGTRAWGVTTLQCDCVTKISRHKQFFNLDSIGLIGLTCARIVGDVAHAVQVEPRVEPLLSAEVHLRGVYVVHVDTHLQHLNLVLLVVWLHKDRLVPRNDNHPLCPVLGVAVPVIRPSLLSRCVLGSTLGLSHLLHVENDQINNCCEGESEDKASDSDEECRVSSVLVL